MSSGLIPCQDRAGAGDRPKPFPDYLILLRLDGRWRIISKAYTYVPIAVEVKEGGAAAE
jgi:hypothetical protein